MADSTSPTHTHTHTTTTTTTKTTKTTGRVPLLRQIELSSSTHTYTANLLDPATQYRFQVMAFTLAGDGPHTPIVTVATLESAARRLERFKAASEGRVLPPDAGNDAGRALGGRKGGGGGDVAAPEVPVVDKLQEWKDMRQAGQHRNKRAPKNDWQSRRHLDGQYEEPVGAAKANFNPQDLSATRPTGAAVGYEADTKQGHSKHVRATVVRAARLSPQHRLQTWPHTSARTATASLPRCLRRAPCFCEWD